MEHLWSSLTLIISEICALHAIAEWNDGFEMYSVHNSSGDNDGDGDGEKMSHAF